MAHHRARLIAAAGAALALSVALAACVPESTAGPSGSPTARPAATGSPTPTATPSATSAAVAIPDDCREILTADVLTQLGDTPLNDPVTEVPAGVQADGSLVCLWGIPGNGASYLMTTITYMSRGTALDGLNALADRDGYTCYTPDGGVRCEKTWFSDPDLLPQGQTLFWRDDIMIDTQFTKLAPTGYTAAIVQSVFG